MPRKNDELATNKPGQLQQKEAAKPLSVFWDTLKDGTQGPEMVAIPTGEFRMGSLPGTGVTDEHPIHDVRIVKAFAMGRYEVSFDEYDHYVRATGAKSPDDKGWGRGKRPVINVSWQDAVAYAQWLSEQAGKHYRLPTEAEWEYAARAKTETSFWWGDEIGKNRANCDGCGSQWDKKQTAPVGSFQANPWGLYDTAGNVWEWVADCYHDNYQNAPSDGGEWKYQSDCQSAQGVIRSGSWGFVPAYLRSSDRHWGLRDSWNYTLGFRLARDL